MSRHRAHREKSRLTIFVNEWELISLEWNSIGTNPMTVALVGTDGSQRWREIRVSEPSGDSPNVSGVDVQQQGIEK